MTPEILYEDNHLVVVNKPFGILTHGDKTGDPSMEDHVKQYIKEKYQKPGNVFSRSVHRLDRPVSGAMIFARTSKAHERMAKAFRERNVRKSYWALVPNMPEPMDGRVEHYLRKNAAKNYVEWSPKPMQGAKLAQTDYKVLRKAGQNWLVELNPITGRSHQLRVMLRSMNSPIVGDVKYQGRKSSNPRAIMLHARKLEFVHPVKKEPITIIADPPYLMEWDSVR